MSRIRKIYLVRLILRIIIFLASVVLIFTSPKEFDIVNGWNFFGKLSIFHLLWLVWMADMIKQLSPVKNIALGSQKIFKEKFRPALHKLLDWDKLKDYIVKTNKAAGRVMIVWAFLIFALCLLKVLGIIKNEHLLLVSIAFYMCDLICVLIWCPFRLMLGNKCCTTCRIFNWDHFMMFTPMLFVGSFFSISLLIMAIINLLVWEIGIYLHPERFWEHSNMALKCSECKDKLCTQYCQKLRKKAD